MPTTKKSKKELAIEQAFRTKQPVVIENPGSEIEIPDDINQERLLEDVFSKTITEEDLEQDQAARSQEFNIAKEMFHKKNIKGMSELTTKQAMIGAKAYWMADRYDMPELKEFLDYWLMLMVSNNRKGRVEGIQAMQAQLLRAEDDRNMFQKVMDKFRGVE